MQLLLPAQGHGFNSVFLTLVGEYASHSNESSYSSAWSKDLQFLELTNKKRKHLKEPQVIETRAYPRIVYVLITAKMQVKIILCNS